MSCKKLPNIMNIANASWNWEKHRSVKKRNLDQTMRTQSSSRYRSWSEGTFKFISKSVRAIFSTCNDENGGIACQIIARHHYQILSKKPHFHVCLQQTTDAKNAWNKFEKSMPPKKLNENHAQLSKELELLSNLKHKAYKLLIMMNEHSICSFADLIQQKNSFSELLNTWSFSCINFQIWFSNKNERIWRSKQWLHYYISMQRKCYYSSML